MGNKKEQIGFRVTEAFRKEIEAESIKRELSIQELITSALELYFRTPSNAPNRSTLAVLGFDEEWLKKEKPRIDLWLKYLAVMPEANIIVYENAMKGELQHYRSSRRKR